MIMKKEFLTALEGRAVHTGDKIYHIESKSFVTPIGIEISVDGFVYFIVEGSSRKFYVNNCVKFDDPSSKCSMHIDDFIDSVSMFGDGKEIVNYAKFFFLLHRLPAYMQMEFAPYIDNFKLFCYYENKKYRITGCSRMGDIWLAADLGRNEGYDLRVCVTDVTDFSDS